MSEQWQDKPEVHTPPVPVDGITREADAVLTARSFWMQPIAPREEQDPFASRMTAGGVVETGAARRVARAVSKTPNPLRELAASLLEFAAQLDANGLVPVGINVHTGYQFADFFTQSQGQRAVVATTVRGVRREWVTEALEETECQS